MCDDKSLLRACEARQGEAERLFRKGQKVTIDIDFGSEKATYVIWDVEREVIIGEGGVILSDIETFHLHREGRVSDNRHQLDRGGDDAAR